MSRVLERVVEYPGAHLPLLLEANPSRDALAQDLARGELYVLRRTGLAVGAVLWRLRGETAEILALAVAPAWRRQGYGRRLVEGLADLARGAGARRLGAGVATCALGALAFWLRCGFRVVAVDRDYFVPPLYPDPIAVDGIATRDRLWLERALP